MPPSSSVLETVDVFETVLVRLTGRPEALFLALGHLQHRRGLTPHSPEVFAETRRIAEQVATDHHLARTTLEHIYAELAWRLDLDEPTAAALRSHELALERRVLRAVPGAAAWLKQLREATGRVVFISDSYFARCWIQELLEEHGLWHDGDGLYVSSDEGASKWRGDLFTLVARREGRRPWQLRHHGNHRRADVRSARRRAVRVSPALDGNPSRYERMLEGGGLSSGGLAGVFSGAARMARLDVAAAGEHDIAVRDVSAGVVAPALAAYVLHVLRHAERTGVKRLYFAARDGEVMLELARPVAERLGVDVELRYLYGSRQAWNAASLTDVDDEALDWILQFATQASVRMVLGRVGLVPEDHQDQLAAHGLTPDALDTVLRATAVEELRAALREEPMRTAVLEHAAERRALLLRFLEQEDLLDGTPYALVDVGWKGRPAAALSAVLTEAGAQHPRRFYYFGLLSELPRRVRADRVAYLFDGGRSLGEGRRVESMATFDVFCTGREGLTVGYEDRDGHVRPVLRTPDNAPALAWGLPVLRAAVESFGRHLVLDAELMDLDGDLRPAVVSVLRAFFEDPTDGEARAWGAYPHSSDQNEGDGYSLARPVPIQAAVRAAATGNYLTDWPAGSRRLSSAPSGALLGTPLAVTSRLRRVAKRLLRPS